MNDLDVFFADVKRQLMTIAPLPGIKGCSLDEIAAAERALGVQLPAAYRGFLSHMGWCSGYLFRGTEVAGASELLDMQADAAELLQESRTTFVLPKSAVVFLFHQGYTFCFIVAKGGEDSPVYSFMEGESEANEVASSFLSYLRASLEQAKAAFGKQQARSRR